MRTASPSAALVTQEFGQSGPDRRPLVRPFVVPELSGQGSLAFLFGPVRAQQGRRAAAAGRSCRNPPWT